MVKKLIWEITKCLLIRYFYHPSYSDSGCNKFRLFSTNETLFVHPDKLGLYIKEDRFTNGRALYRHVDNYFHFYWINEYGGYWMVKFTTILLANWVENDESNFSCGLKRQKRFIFIDWRLCRLNDRLHSKWGLRWCE